MMSSWKPLFTTEMMKTCISDGVPDNTIIAASPKIAESVKAMADEIHGILPSLDRSRIEKVLWQRLIDKGAVVAITNIGSKH